MLWYLMQHGNCYMVGMGSHTVVNPLKGNNFSSLYLVFRFFLSGMLWSVVLM